MTNEELGKRLDRLDGKVQNLDDRLARVEQILPTLASKADLGIHATKRDLEAFATKTDLEAFATKRDLEQFATKRDLEQFATKQDLEQFATKQDLEQFATKRDLEQFATRQDLEGFATKKDLEAFATKKDLEAFATKKDLERYPTKKDLAAELKAFAEREGSAMRQFVMDVVRKSEADTRAEMRMLFEAQNRKIDAVIDLHRAELARIAQVDDSARTRDAALDHRVSELERQSRDGR